MLEDAAEVLERLILQHGTHSFQYFRDHTPLQLSDRAFVALVNYYPNRFEIVRIIARDPHGDRVIPGRPGVRLRREQESALPVSAR